MLIDPRLILYVLFAGVLFAALAMPLVAAEDVPDPRAGQTVMVRVACDAPERFHDARELFLAGDTAGFEREIQSILAAGHCLDLGGAPGLFEAPVSRVPWERGLVFEIAGVVIPVAPDRGVRLYVIGLVEANAANAVQGAPV